MRVSVQEVVFDCHDIAAQARFWGLLLDVPHALVDAGWAIVDAGPIRLGFQPVPEGKSVKNRVHLDLEVSDLQDAIEHATALGARCLTEPFERDNGTGFVVMADPEEHEFCFVIDHQGAYATEVEEALEAAPGESGDERAERREREAAGGRDA